MCFADNLKPIGVEVIENEVLEKLERETEIEGRIRERLKEVDSEEVDTAMMIMWDDYISQTQTQV